MKVFVASTVYDLLDVRAEIADFLRSIGIVPVLSDDKLSDFAVQPDTNSIETCLVNVDACDEIIFILDRRYGRKLGEYGFDNVSATHLEYRRAVKDRKKMHFYVRDRLEADYNIWKNNKKRQNLKLSWVCEKKDWGLMDFLEERRKLDSDVPNWITPFTSIVDLKASLRHYFDEAFLPERLANAIYQNDFPFMNVAVTFDAPDNHSDPINFTVTTTNLGKTTAVNFQLRFEILGESKTQQQVLPPGLATGKGNTERQFLLPGQSVSYRSEVPIMQLDVFPASNDDIQRSIVHHVQIEYDTMLGVSVREQHKVYIRISQTPAIRLEVQAGSETVKREYYRGKRPKLEIADKTPSVS